MNDARVHLCVCVCVGGGGGGGMKLVVITVTVSVSSQFTLKSIVLPISSPSLLHVL